MIAAIIFDLWETIGTKNVAVGKLLREKFDIPEVGDYLGKYEAAVQLKNWETEERMAGSFLSAFGIGHTPENVAFVIDVFRQGVEKATVFDGMQELLVSLKQKGLRLGLLSNTTVFESAAIEKWGMGGLFDVTMYSWQTGALKPSREAFNQMLRELGVPAEQALLVDDTKRNIESARELGMQCVEFRDVPALKNSLKALGI